jgi:hypothetical protein
MIYLTFDSNIWIYSLDESWQIENQLDYLEPWIQNGEVKLLLPNIIIKEWEKHEGEQVSEREKKLKDFFEMAEEILPSAFYSEYKEPLSQRKIIANQLLRAKNIILNSEIIPDYNEVKQRVIDDGIAKKAPLHKKSSIADAIIVFSLIQYAKIYPGNHYYFVSNNTEDFHQKIKGKKEIHQDLKADFDSNNIQTFTTLNQLTYFLQTAHGLKVDENIKQIKKERIRNKIKEKVYNPEYDRLTESGESSYIQNISTIEFILKEKKPTKEQVIFVLALIDSEDSYERDFYKKLSSSSWFEILKRKEVFKPENNPLPVQVKNGYQIPFWEPIGYLEKLSLQIKNGQELELIDELIAVINNVSKKPVDNYRTWTLFIKILTNLPNEKIPVETLQFIPIWLRGKFDTILQSSELCENLLPKFLSDNPTPDDIAKAELILKCLLSIEKSQIVQQDGFGTEVESYRSRIHMRYLTASLVEKKMTAKIVANCSYVIITELADTIKKLYFDFPNGINVFIKKKENKYNIKTVIENENISISIFQKNNPEIIIGTKQLLKFENLNENETKETFLAILKEFNIKYLKTEDNSHNIAFLLNALTSGSYYTSSDDTISKLNDRYNYGDKIVEVFALIFRDLLNDKVKQNINTGIALLKLFALENQYRLPFFRRVVLFVIGENWGLTKSVFWELLNGNDSKKIFSNYNYEKDTYELLNKNQTLLNKKEIKTIQKIIDLGPQDKSEKSNPKDVDYWQLRWYSALRNLTPFKERYEKLSQSEKLTNEHFENLGVIKARVGSVSPFSMEEILEHSNEEIVNFIHAFKPKDNWEEPTIDGLSSSLGKAIENEPQRFADEIELYKDVYYIYAYRIAYGFKDAWKNKKIFNWEKVLNFYNEYVTSEGFVSRKFSLQNDSWGVTSDWVIGAVGNLLSDGMQSEINSFDLKLLPIVKEILSKLVPNLKLVEDFKQTNMDYASYSLNSTAGKVLRTLLDYSLYRARNLKAEDMSPKWEDDVKSLMDEAFKKGVIDSYIITGWYFQQFYFLDKDWIISKVEEFYKLDDKKWIAFLNGFALGNPPFNTDIYQLFYQHYERAIKQNIEIKSPRTHGIIRHIVAFYFWGFEDLKTEGLLVMLISNGSSSTIIELINFVCRQEDYLRSLDSKEAKKFETIIFDLWTYLVHKFENTVVEDEQKILAELSNLLGFVPELSENYTSLVLKSSILSEKHFQTYYLIENLIKLKDKGNPIETAKHIGLILNSIPFTGYFSTIENKHIIELVVFLYENVQKKIAEEICNKLTKQGYEFLITVHNKYKD